jgi:hypothetical protein
MEFVAITFCLECYKSEFGFHQGGNQALYIQHTVYKEERIRTVEAENRTIGFSQAILSALAPTQKTAE